MATSKRAGFVAIFLHITIKWPVLLLVREGSGHKNIGNILIFKWKKRGCFAFAKLLKHFPRFLSRYPLSVSRFYVPLHPSVPLLPREVPKESPRQPLGRSFSTIYKNRAFFCKTKSLPKGAIPEESVVFHSFHFCPLESFSPHYCQFLTGILVVLLYIRCMRATAPGKLPYEFSLKGFPQAPREVWELFSRVFLRPIRLLARRIPIFTPWTME